MPKLYLLPNREIKLDILSRKHWIELDQYYSEEDIQELRARGIHIVQIASDYVIIPELALLDSEFLKLNLSPRKVVIKRWVDSTNTYMTKHISDFSPADICVADYQYSGRGRMGRTWSSNVGGSIALSFYYCCNNLMQINGLSLVVGLAVVKALEYQGYSDLSLKWPNDILLLGKKLGGILVEILPKSNNQFDIVIGLGLNLVLPQAVLQSNPTWTHLSMIHNDIQPNLLLVLIYQYLYQYVTDFFKLGISSFVEEWNRYDHFLQQKVILYVNNQVIQGVEQGIDKTGAICILNQQGVQKFIGGEISLRRDDSCRKIVDINLA
ncbi:biotin--[acetyl-CoA-carboxylase] ligase [Neisseriaceae bacterium PsAf]|nr:biotin--[acetyl-CoA-carboxylase] ligase [Neisseriaceae bacterium PsAf]